MEDVQDICYGQDFQTSYFTSLFFNPLRSGKVSQSIISCLKRDLNLGLQLQTCVHIVDDLTTRPPMAGVTGYFKGNKSWYIFSIRLKGLLVKYEKYEILSLY